MRILSREGAGGGSTPLRWLWEWTKVAATALLLFLVLRAFVIEAFQIPTSSMEDTLLVGDFLLVNKAAYGAEVPGTGWDVPGLEQPGVGDVVVFRPPGAARQPAGARYVKRVVGGPGDTLSMRSGRLYRNGRPVDEPYVRGRAEGREAFRPRFLWQERYLVASERSDGEYRPTRSDWGPLTVPPDSLFVLGDNRPNSEDSRYWGFVPREAVTGKPLFIYYSYRRAAVGPAPWHDRIRWGRIFSTVR